MKRGLNTIKNVIRNLDLPADTFTGGARMEVIGNSEVNIDGCKGILDYSDTAVKISTGKGSITVIGTNLLISRFIDDNISVTGTLCAINFNS